MWKLCINWNWQREEREEEGHIVMPCGGIDPSYGNTMYRHYRRHALTALRRSIHFTRERRCVFKRPVLKAKLLRGTGGFRSPLVSIRREFIVAIPTCSRPWKGREHDRLSMRPHRGEMEERRLWWTQQVREMLSSSRYPFVSLELGQSWTPRRTPVSCSVLSLSLSRPLYFRSVYFRILPRLSW